VLFLIQNHWGSSGVWYLVGLGMAAILFALLLPRGLWGTLRDRYSIQLLPVGRFLVERSTG
jgi:branched-chain amino acid transport system permease protein